MKNSEENRVEHNLNSVSVHPKVTNLSNTVIPKKMEDLLSLGLKFAPPVNLSKQVVKNLVVYCKLASDSQNSVKHTFCNIISDLIKNHRRRKSVGWLSNTTFAGNTFTFSYFI